MRDDRWMYLNGVRYSQDTFFSARFGAKEKKIESFDVKAKQKNGYLLA